MSPERWSVVGPLLDAMIELDPAARGRFLAEHCGGDGALRDELTSLVLDCEVGESLLDAPAAVAFASLLADQTIDLPPVLGDRYRIVREIGRGGMATVYVADDPKHGRQVAVKVLHADVARLIGRERFAQEIEIAAGLSHPHILPLHDSGEVASGNGVDASSLYFVSPFVAGESLRDRMVREPRLSTEETVRLAREVALALDYAHRRGVVHLDIKPENILLLDGHAIIADFGIARAMSGANHHARTVGDSRTQPAILLTARLTSQPLLGTPSYMSPEQASAVTDVDGRSDIYSLGCVLYEMITGHRALWRITSEVPGPHRLAWSPPSGVALTDHASDQLAAVVMRAMAPLRDDRFASASAMAQALDQVLQKPSAPRWRLGAVPLACALVVGVGALFAWIRARGGEVLDANLVAVAPFDVATPSLALWREGMVDVMSRNLDGAGPLRSVAPTTVIRGWSGRADPQSARALGQRTGARLVVFGGLLDARDSVRANVVLFDAQTGRKLAELEQRDLVDRMDRLSDSLTVSVLRELGRSRRIDVARATSAPTTSLTSLKWYLQGEQFYRAARWDSAQAYFERALSLDTAFALAYHRLAGVRKPRGVRDSPDSIAHALMRMPSRFPQGLAPRELLLATVDSLSAEAHFAWNPGSLAGDAASAIRIVRLLYATLDSALIRYPNDPELSFLLADARARYELDIGYDELDDRAVLSLFDRAIALDSSFAPAYIVPMSLAAFLDGADSARRYVRAYRALHPTGVDPRFLHVADILLDADRAASTNVAALVDSLSVDELCQASMMMRHIPDSAEVVVHMARTLARLTSASPPRTAGPNCAFTQLVEGLQFRGHLREALNLASLQVHHLRPTVMLGMARFGLVPADSARTAFKRILSLAPRLKLPKLLSWWATDGDTVAIATYVNMFRNEMKRPLPPAEVAMHRANATAGDAYLALARRDTASAVRQLLAVRDTLNACWSENRAAFVTVLIAAGHVREAAKRLERRWPGTSGCSNGFDDVVWTMQRARVFERAGRRSEAAENYAFVVAAWQNADRELQPLVREARAAVARLGSGKARPEGKVPGDE